MEEHKHFFKWYKTKVTENLEEPPPQVWDKIADELDTNDVWNRIAADLDARAGWFPNRVLYYSLAVLLLLFVTGGSYYYLQNNDGVTLQTVTVRTGTTEQNGQTSRHENKIDRDLEPARSTDPGTSFAEIPSGTKSENTEDKSTRTDRDPDPARSMDQGTSFADIPSGTKSKNTEDESAMSQSLFDSTKRISLIALADKSSSRASLSRVVLHDSMLSVTVGRSAIPGILRASPVPPDDDLQTFRKAFLFGITASAKNTWLLNRQTLSGLEKKTLHSTTPDFGKDLGIVIAYDFSPLFALQAEGNFLSDMGQRYKEYRNGKYVEREIDLVYYNANLMLKYSPHKYRHGFTGSAHAVTGGFFYSLLKHSFERIDGRPTLVDEDYASNDYGAIIGYEYNRYLGERFEFTTALRMNLGLRDIGTNSWLRTTSGSFGLNVAIKYRLLLD